MNNEDTYKAHNAKSRVTPRDSVTPNGTDSTDARVALLDALDKYFDDTDRRTMRTWLALILGRLPDAEVAALAIRLEKRQNKPKPR